MKPLYKGTFNWHREMIEEYVRVPSDVDKEKEKNTAWFLLTLRVAMMLKRSHYSVRQYFSEEKNNHEITLIKEEEKKV